MEMPKDILLKIDELCPAIEDNQTARHLLEEIRQTTTDVSYPQLVRSILTLSEGNISVIRKIVDSDFYGDLKDVIMKAEKKLGNPGHYFIPAFNLTDPNKND